MNVNAIWAGEEYAFWDYKGNKAFIMNARRGKCIRTEKEQPRYGGSRAKAYAIFEELNPDTGESSGREVKIRARDVIDEWTAYSNEREGIRRERAEKEELDRQERERRQVEREERIRQEREIREARERQQAQQQQKLVDAFINRTGIPKEAIVSVGTQYISLDRTAMEFWLSIPDNRGGMST
jgi:hypothetical protein